MFLIYVYIDKCHINDLVISSQHIQIFFFFYFWHHCNSCVICIDNVKGLSPMYPFFQNYNSLQTLTPPPPTPTPSLSKKNLSNLRWKIFNQCNGNHGCRGNEHNCWLLLEYNESFHAYKKIIKTSDCMYYLNVCCALTKL